MSDVLAVILGIDLIVGLFYWLCFIDKISNGKQDGLSILDIVLQVLFLPVSIITYIVVSIVTLFYALQSKLTNSLLTKVVIKFKLR